MKSAKYRDQPNTTDDGVNFRRWPYRAIASEKLANRFTHTDITGLGFGGEFTHPHVVEHALT